MWQQHYQIKKICRCRPKQRKSFSSKGILKRLKKKNSTEMLIGMETRKLAKALDYLSTRKNSQSQSRFHLFLNM